MRLPQKSFGDAAVKLQMKPAVLMRGDDNQIDLFLMSDIENRPNGITKHDAE